MTLPIASLALFPLYPIAEGKCGCGDALCTRVGKHPAMLWSELGIAEQEAGPEEWGEPGAAYGLGVCTGHRSGVFVVDLDVKPARGIDGVAAFAALGGSDPTYTVRGPKGGLHLYFTLPDFPVKTSGGQVGPGIDVRGEGGFVVAPGSPHWSGGTYETILDVPLAPAPAWLLAMPCLRGRVVTEREAGELGVEPVDISTPEGRAAVEKAERFLREEAIAAIDGKTPGAGFKTALRLMRGYRLPLDVAHTLWEEIYNPRCEPPWSEFEIEHKLIDARDKASTPTGLPSDGYLASLALPDPARDAVRAPRRPLTTIHAERRKVKRPDHVYTHTGNEQARSDAKQVDVGEFIHTFTSHEDWSGVWQYDEFKKALRAVEPPMMLDAETSGMSEEDVTFVGSWFRSRLGMLAPDATIRSAIRAAGKLCRFHPVREYLQTLPEVTPADARAFLESLAGRVLGVDEEHARVWLSRYLVAAVRRVLEPGTKVDTMLVLYGGQGAHKSTFCEALFGREWFRRQMPELNGRDGSHALEGFWGIEIGELAGVLKEETRTVKEFLSREVDHYRQFGNGEKVEFPRQCVFIGTTNEREFLRDPTGERRFWPIGLPEEWLIPVAWVREHQKQIWASALALALLPTSETRPDLVAAGGTFDHWTTRAEDDALAGKKEEFHQEDPWLGVLRDHCAGRIAVKANTYLYTDVIAGGEEGAMAKMTHNTSVRISACMQRLGCKYQSVRVDGGVVKGWRVPDALAKSEPSTSEIAKRKRAGVSEEIKRVQAHVHN